MNSGQTKIDLKEIKRQTRQIALAGPGDFSIRDIYTDLALYDDAEKQAAREELDRLKTAGELQPIGSRRGWYRRIDRSLHVIDFRSASTEEFDLRLPFDLDKRVRIFPKSLIAISGEKNTGKTAVCLNIVKRNMNRGLDIYYFSSEMLAPEMRVRLEAFPDVPFEDWNFVPVHRTADFADVIQPDSINIIDFLEIYDKFWEIGRMMTDIWNALNTGVAVVCVQKSGHADHGRGGTFLIEKPRLTINLGKKLNTAGELDGATLHITNCKFPRYPSLNPSGKCLDYKIHGGAELVPETKHDGSPNWYVKK